MFRGTLWGKIFFFVRKLIKSFFSVSERVIFKTWQNCGSSFNEAVLYRSGGTCWRKVFLFWWKPIFLSGLRAKNFFSAINCRQECQNRILPIKKDVPGLWMSFKAWTNITKTGTKFVIFVWKMHPSRRWYYFTRLMMEENDSAAG